MESVITDPETRYEYINNIILSSGGNGDQIISGYQEGSLNIDEVLRAFISRDMHSEYSKVKYGMPLKWEIELALTKNARQILEIMLRRKPGLVNIGTDNDPGKHIISIAIENGSEDCAQILFNHPNFNLYEHDHCRTDPHLFISACVSGNEYCVKLAHQITQGKFVNEPLKTPDNTRPCTLAFMNGMPFLWDIISESPLFDGAGMGEVITKMIWAPNWIRYTDYALMIRKMFKSPKCQTRITHNLLKTQVFIQTRHGPVKVPLLMAACHHGNFYVMKEVINRNKISPGDSSIYIKDDIGRGIMWYVCTSRSVILTKLCLDSNAYPWINRDGINPALVEKNIAVAEHTTLYKICIKCGPGEILDLILSNFKCLEMLQMARRVIHALNMHIQNLDSMQKKSIDALNNFVKDYENKWISQV